MNTENVREASLAFRERKIKELLDDLNNPDVAIIEQRTAKVLATLDSSKDKVMLDMYLTMYDMEDMDDLTFDVHIYLPQGYENQENYLKAPHIYYFSEVTAQEHTESISEKVLKHFKVRRDQVLAYLHLDNAIVLYNLCPKQEVKLLRVQ